jgi:hypothetical protein
MSSESVCQVARSWVDVGSFYAFSGEVSDFYSVSPKYFGYILLLNTVTNLTAVFSTEPCSSGFNTYNTGAHNFQKSTIFLKILGARMVA